jgi:Peptidase M16 inactive domain
VHEEVRKFWEAHYSANVMRAALVSRHSLDELEAFARAAFSSIADKQLAAPSFSGELPCCCDPIPWYQQRNLPQKPSVTRLSSAASFCLHGTIISSAPPLIVRVASSLHIFAASTGSEAATMGIACPLLL